MIKTILGLLLVTCSHISFAGQLSNSYDKCMKNKQTNQEWEFCTSQEVALQEKFLTKAWEDVKKLFKDSAELSDSYDELLNEQRQWIKYKDAACEYFLATSKEGAHIFGREGVVLHYGLCKAHVISDRVEDLHGIKEQHE